MLAARSRLRTTGYGVKPVIAAFHSSRGHPTSFLKVHPWRQWSPTTILADLTEDCCRHVTFGSYSESTSFFKSHGWYVIELLHCTHPPPTQMYV